jgi:hypothetical protein
VAARERLRVSLRRAAPALAVFAAVRLTGVVLLTTWALHLGRHPRNVLGFEWDSAWYWRIATYGYGTIIHSHTPGIVWNDLAFFPLYPGLIRALDTVLPISAVNAALVISWISSIAAAWGIYAVVELLHRRRTAIALVALFAVLPQSVVLTLAYTEPLMIALSAWALYATFTRRWLVAGVLAALAGLTRPNGLAVAAAVVSAVAVDTWQRRRDRRPPDARAWAGAVLAPLGWLGYVAWVGFRTGSPLGYFDVQSKWGSRFDFGHYAIYYVRQLIVGQGHLASYGAAAIVLGAVVLFVLAVLDRQPLPLLVYTAVLMVMALGGSHFFPSKPRFLLPAFPLLLPLAVPLARIRLRKAVVVVAAMAGFSLFYGTYLLTVAHQAP